MGSSKRPPTNSAGDAFGNVAASLPYNHLVFKGEDAKQTMVGQALQTLCILLDFQSDIARDVLSNMEDPLSAAPTAKTNAFRYFLAKLVCVSLIENRLSILITWLASAFRLQVYRRWHPGDTRATYERGE